MHVLKFYLLKFHAFYVLNVSTIEFFLLFFKSSPDDMFTD